MSHGPLSDASDPVADTEPDPSTEPVDAIVALRLADARQLAAELASWHPRPQDGGPDGAAPPVRLADLGRPPDLGHPLVVALLHELAALVAAHAARTGPAAVTVRGTGSPGGAARGVVVTASWWSLVARHPGGPVLVLADGNAGVHDLADAPGVAALLDTATHRHRD